MFISLGPINVGPRKVFTMTSKINPPKCSIPNCNEPGEFVPGFDYLNKGLERPIRPEKLAANAFCKKHKHVVEAAARQQQGENIRFYPYASAYAECERFHAQRDERQAEDEVQHKARIEREAEEKIQAEAAKQRFEQELEEYLDRLFPNMMTDHKGIELPDVVRCSFGTCGHEAAHEAMFVPPLSELNRALGHDVLPEDLPAFAVCSDHRKAVEKRNSSVQFHRLSAARRVIERNREARETYRQDKAAADVYVAGLFGKKEEGSNNIISLDTGAVRCIGKGCQNVIPAGRKTSFCDSHAHKCPGCGKRIPTWYKKCRECPEETAKPHKTGKTARKRFFKQSEERRQAEAEARKKAEAEYRRFLDVATDLGVDPNRVDQTGFAMIWELAVGGN